MFKKLRNKLLIVNTLIIAALVIGSFSVIYIITLQNTNRNIDIKLERSINFAKDDHEPRMGDREREGAEPSNGETPPPKPEDDMRRMPDGEPPEMRENSGEPFSLTFTVTTANEGNSQKKNMPFDLTEDFYTDKISGIILSKNNQGQLTSDNGLWAYRVVKTDTGYIVAFTDINSEHNIMLNLLIVLSIVALLSLVAAFLISLFNANRSIKPVEDSYNKQKQFVADASHELKTPLTTINTNVDVLLTREDSTIGAEKKWLQYIKTETERMTKLTNDLLYLARLDHNENAVMLSPVSFSEAAESVILLMEAVVFEKNVNMTYDIAPDLTVNGNMEQLKQLVMILLDNACKYTPEKGNIQVKLKRTDSAAVFTVRNSGEGISDEALEHIFERFYREDKSRARKSGGYGLGLAIAKAITESYKGSIKAESVKNEYTQFTVKIPLVK
ncbi:MAG: HAMP domain-containing histidine kinase [Clostridia bacterium]|nr:HAMP domain-containing histidine kinase [Clostridia bacterium]